MNDSGLFPGSDGRDHDEQRLRRLLDESVSDVEPRPGLDAIHARTKVTSMHSKRPWILAAGAAVVATAATVAAVTVLSDDSPVANREPDFAASSPSESAEPAPSPSPTHEPGTSPSTEPSSMQTVPVYYVGETSRGPRLFREFHRAQVTGDQVSAALTEAVAGSPNDPDYRTDWPDGTSAHAGFDGVGSDGEIAIVLSNDSLDLRERPSGMTAEQAQMAVEQLIYTAQAASQTRAPVQFYLQREGAEGNRTDTVLGVPASEPLAQGNASDVLAQVWIIEPAEGAEVSVPFTVSGLAAAFEANVQWELLQGDRVVRRGFTTAEECCTMAPYEFTVSQVPAGDYTLVVHDSDPSGGEGPAPWQDTKQLTVLP